MTVDDCQAVLTTLRRKQGTRCPIVRIDHPEGALWGRLVRCDSDPEHRAAVPAPHARLFVEEPGRDRREVLSVAIAELGPAAVNDGRVA
jgi:hypothetical protein